MERKITVPDILKRNPPALPVPLLRDAMEDAGKAGIASFVMPGPLPIVPSVTGK